MKVASFSPIGLVALAVLVAQMSGLTLAMRASRTQGQLYSVSAAVLLTEGLKLAVCVAFAVARRAQALGGGGLSCAAAWEGVAWVASTAAPIALPALLFVATQQLNLCAATELDAVTFQVTNQLKILPTAWFSVLTLNRSLPAQQWASLPVLAVGVAVVNLSSRPAEAAAAREHGRAPRFGLGLAAALAAACFSGYASVYVERLLKTERLTWPAPAAAGSEAGFEPLPGDNWEAMSPLGRRGSVTDVFTFGAEMEAEAAAARGRLPPLAEEAGPATEEDGRPLLTLNIQLAAWGAAIAAAQLAWQSPGAEGGGLLAGFNAAAWAVVWLQALGGLVVGLVLKYTDNIVKGFATAVSILLSCVLERAQQRAWPSPSFLAGLGLVMASFALFSGPEDLLTRVTSGPALQAAMEAARAARGASAQAAARAAAAAAVALLLLYAALSGGGAGGWAGGAGEAVGLAAARGVPAATIAPGQMQARWAQARAAGAETTSADVGGAIDLASVRRARLPPPPPPPAAALPNATARAWGGDADAHAARQRASLGREAGAAQAAQAEALAAEMELRQADSALNPDEAAFAGGMALETELGSFGGGAAPPPRAVAVGPLAAEAARAWPLHREALGPAKKLD